MGNLIEIKGVSKFFQKTIALDHVDLSIPEKSIFGLLGPNGAGKTTLIRNITQITGPDSGEILFNGKLLSPQDGYNVGYMPEERGLYKKMKVGEQLLYLAQIKGMKKAEAKKEIIRWMEKFEIGSWYYKKVEDLSKGMQQKVQFISTILNRPKLLILDEPFTGLDPINANLLKNEIIELQESGSTIIFSTHRMESVEEMCDEIALINKGKIILSGKVKDIKDQFKQNLYSVELSQPLEKKVDFGPFDCQSVEGNNLLFKLSADQTPNDLVKAILEKGLQLHGLVEVLPTINDIFISQVEKSNTNA